MKTALDGMALLLILAMAVCTDGLVEEYGIWTWLEAGVSAVGAACILMWISGIMEGRQRRRKRRRTGRRGDKPLALPEGKKRGGRT